MIDGRFSAMAFEKAGYGTKESRKLSKKLQLEIQNELDAVVDPAILKIINKLNRLGHNLLTVGKTKPGDKVFREPFGEKKTNQKFPNYKFLVALDIVVSVGYPETVDSDDVLWIENS